MQILSVLTPTPELTLCNGEIAIGYAGSKITTTKAATMKIPVYFHGNETAKANATLIVKIIFV